MCIYQQTSKDMSSDLRAVPTTRRATPPPTPTPAPAPRVGSRPRGRDLTETGADTHNWVIFKIVHSHLIFHMCCISNLKYCCCRRYTAKGGTEPNNVAIQQQNRGTHYGIENVYFSYLYSRHCPLTCCSYSSGVSTAERLPRHPSHPQCPWWCRQAKQ